MSVTKPRAALAADLTRGLLELLCPSSCAGCEFPLADDEHGFCGGCLSLIEHAPQVYQPPRPVAAGFEYGGPLAEALQALKYRHRTDLVPVLGGLLATVARPYAGRVDCVVPTPLHPRRLRQRGFNQTALLSAVVAKDLGVPLRALDLRRIRDTPHQARLARTDRAANLRGAFVATAHVSGRRVLLIDDVRTTGATLAAAAEVVVGAGAAEVFTLALARAAL